MRRDLPAGTVTFLFTDVEGSTKLLHELGAEGYAERLAEHRRVVREACIAQGGVEVDTQGDAFFVAFPTAPGALKAARAITEELASGPITLRIGLHTGRPLLTEEGYVGEDVHFAARVAASAHGRQVVLSQATRALIDERYPLVELGEHRLKDIPEPVAIFQLGDGQFPPLKTISNTNLPRPASSFVGRERELQEVLARIEEGGRLVTLTGPGGSGKTRLALEAAATLVPEYKAGVFWVGLASLRDATLVTETIRQTLGAKDGLANHIGERQMLLLLDNLEQVIEAAPELSSLLQRCPNLTLLATSRELLRVQGEIESPVPPLAEGEAASLFCERAATHPTAEVSELCRRLDNLPLAVELAAARAKALSPGQILERLSQRLDVLKGGRDADPRQQTLRATIQWSHDLLSTGEQRLFRCLSVFSGGCTLEAAEEVCDADLDKLQSLVEKSLLRFSSERYWMLETIKEYALEQLTMADELADLRGRHAAWVIETMGEGSTPWYGRTTPEWLARADREHANVREALLHLADAGPAEDLARLVVVMRNFWFLKGGLAEGARWLEAALTGVGPTSSHRGELLIGWTVFLRRLGELDRALAAGDEAIAYFRERQSAEGVVSALRALGAVYEERGDLDRAAALIAEAFALGRNIDYPDLAVIAAGRVELELAARRWDRARELACEAAALASELGDDNVTTWAAEFLAVSFLVERRYDEAQETVAWLVEAAFASDKTIFVVDALKLLAVFAAGRSRFADAARLIGAADAVGKDVHRGRDPIEEELLARAISDGRAALGKEGWERALADGAALGGTSAASLARDALAAAEAATPTRETQSGRADCGETKGLLSS
jgi:predicted ATPase/class 3 adenylate cyclase